MLLLDNARARAVSPLHPQTVADNWPPTIARTGDWWHSPSPDAHPLRWCSHRPPGPVLIDIPAPWPGLHTLRGPPGRVPDVDVPLAAALGLLPRDFTKHIVDNVAGSCEVRAKRLRRSLAKALPRMQLDLLCMCYLRYCRSHAARRASWSAGAAGAIASGSADLLAWRAHERGREARSASFQRALSKSAARLLAKRRIEYVARQLGMSAAAYRASIGSTGANRPIPPHHQSLLLGFDPTPPGRSGLRSSQPGAPSRRVYAGGEYVVPPDDPVFDPGPRSDDARSALVRTHGMFL